MNTSRVGREMSNVERLSTPFEDRHLFPDLAIPPYGNPLGLVSTSKVSVAPPASVVRFSMRYYKSELGGFEFRGCGL
ncbi:hypothetical protein VKT23_014067 [Stygiomarasmius scandens]|uniref:Uncharacterized protein n=1 Tax=Marasmiellus scandens TaxID=2682957 RepID=A0ABR1J5V8_9AGAR